MKKYIIVALLSILSISVMAQEKGVIDKVATTVGNAVDSGKKAVTDAVYVMDTSSNFRKIYTDVKEGIGDLSSSLKVGAEHVYTVLVKQQIVNAIVDLMWVLILIACIIMFSRNIGPAFKEDKYDVGPAGLKCIMSAVIGLLFFMGLLITNSFNEMVMGFINPEYGAIKDIIDIVNPK